MADKLKPTIPEWLKLYTQYDESYFTPGKLVTAEEWNTLFKANVAQGNYLTDTLDLLINDYLPERLNVQDNAIQDIDAQVTATTARVQTAVEAAIAAQQTAQESRELAQIAYNTVDNVDDIAQEALIKAGAAEENATQALGSVNNILVNYYTKTEVDTQLTSVARTDTKNTFVPGQYILDNTNVTAPLTIGGSNAAIGRRLEVTCNEGIHWYYGNISTAYAGLTPQKLHLNSGVNDVARQANIRIGGNNSVIFESTWLSANPVKYNMLDLTVQATGDELIANQTVRGELNMGKIYLCTADSADGTVKAGRLYQVGGEHGAYTLTDVTPTTDVAATLEGRIAPANGKSSFNADGSLRMADPDMSQADYAIYSEAGMLVKNNSKGSFELKYWNGAPQCIIRDASALITQLYNLSEMQTQVAGDVLQARLTDGTILNPNTIYLCNTDSTDGTILQGRLYRVSGTVNAYTLTDVTPGGGELPETVAYTDVSNTFTKVQKFNTDVYMSTQSIIGSSGGYNAHLQSQGLYIGYGGTPGAYFNHNKLQMCGNVVSGAPRFSITVDTTGNGVLQTPNIRFDFRNTMFQATGDDLIAKQTTANALNLEKAYICSADSTDGVLKAGHIYLIGGASGNYTFTDLLNEGYATDADVEDLGSQISALQNTLNNLDSTYATDNELAELDIKLSSSITSTNTLLKKDIRDLQTTLNNLDSTYATDTEVNTKISNMFSYDASTGTLTITTE